MRFYLDTQGIGFILFCIGSLFWMVGQGKSIVIIGAALTGLGVGINRELIRYHHSDQEALFGMGRVMGFTLFGAVLGNFLNALI